MNEGIACVCVCVCVCVQRLPFSSSFSFVLCTSFVCGVCWNITPLHSFLLQSFDRSLEDHDLQKEIERRMSGTFASSGLFSLNMSETEKAVDVTIDPAASYGCKSRDLCIGSL